MALVIAHNHPSGDPTPSPADRDLTTRLTHAGAQLGINLLDHVVLAAGGRVFSFAEQCELRLAA